MTEHPHEPRTPLSDFARRVVPQLDVVSVSSPEPVPSRHNVVAFVRSPDHGRQAVVALEDIERDDGRIGLVVMGGDVVERHDGTVDPEGVTRSIAPRLLLGALVGALVGAIVVGGATWLVADDDGIVPGAALGGAAMFATFGAVWATFAGFGGSDAYRQTFVEPHVDELAIVTLHTDDPDVAERGFERLSAFDHLGVMLLDSSMSTVVRERPPTAA